MREEKELLRKRADKFYKYGILAFKNQDFEIAAFNLEQTAQLYLKYTLSILIGDFPKLHSLRRLMEEIVKVSKNKELEILLNLNIGTKIL